MIKFSSIILLLLPLSTTVRADDQKVVCPKTPLPVPQLARKQIYRDTPFKAGESAVYELSWAGLKAGYGTLEVRKPRKYKKIWHQVFHVKASTGDWFKAVFVAKEKLEALSRPDFAISKFYLEQNEGKLFSRPFVQKKFLEFDHIKCKVKEKIVKPDEKDEIDSFDLQPGAMDTIGVIYKLRTRAFRIGQKVRELVYSSEKNWWLEADPLGVETIEVPAGKYKAMKLKLTTFLGKELQQQGDVFAWVAVGSPHSELVQLKGEIKIGSVYIKLHKFKPGR